MSRFTRWVLFMVLFAGSTSLSAQPATRRADSLRNGILTGAVVGAIGGAFTGLAISQDCPECYGFHVPLTLTAVGAGLGIGVGAGIDAVRRHQSAPHSTRRPAGVVPWLSPRVRGAMIWVRF